MDSIEVRGKEVYPEAAGDGQKPPAEAKQRQESPSYDTGPECAATASQTQTEPGHAASADR